MSNNLPEVSIIIPCFNVADYISNTIQNCLNQSFANFELILINDSSEDLSKKIIEEYQKADDRIKLINNQIRRGAGYSRNVGLKNSLGKYVIFLDADDYFNLSLIEKLYFSIKDHNSQIAICNYTSIDETYPFDTREFYKEEFIPEYSDKCTIFQKFTSVVWNKLYEKKFLTENSIIFDELLKNNDFGFVYKAFLLADKISCVDDYLVDYKYNSTDSISNKITNLDDFFDAVSGLYYFINNTYKNSYAILKAYIKQVEYMLLYYILIQNNKTKLNKTNKFIGDFDYIKKKFKLDNSVINSVINNKPLISILIPVYNAEKFISRTIKSLLDQSMPLIDVIVVDDGSTDNSAKIISSFQKKDPRIKYFYQKNSGPSFARQLALSKVESPFVMFCDSDDYYEPEMCREMIFNLWRSRADFAMCDCNIIYETREHHRTQAEINYHHLKQFGVIKLTNNLKQGEISVTLWNKIFRMSKIIDYNISFPSCREHDDSSFVWQYIAAANTVYGINKRLYNYVLRGNSIMGSLYNKVDINRLYELIYSLNYTVNKLYKFYSFKERFFFIKVIDNQLSFFSSKLTEEQKILFFKVARKTLFKSLSKFEINRSYFIKNIYYNQNSKHLECLNNTIKQSNSNNIAKQNHANNTQNFFIKKIVSQTKFEYRFIGISLFKLRLNNNIISFYLFGIRLFKSSWNKTI